MWPAEALGLSLSEMRSKFSRFLWRAKNALIRDGSDLLEIETPASEVEVEAEETKARNLFYHFVSLKL